MFRSTAILLLSLAFIVATQTAFSANVGDSAPSFRARTLDGSQTVSNDDLKGKVIFVDFWASWCAPCLKSLPEFEHLQTSFSGRDDVVVLAINLDENPQDATKFVNKLSVSYKILVDTEGKIPELFGVSTMPSSFVIDKEGIIRYVHKGYKSGDVNIIKSQIEQLL